LRANSKPDSNCYYRSQNIAVNYFQYLPLFSSIFGVVNVVGWSGLQFIIMFNKQHLNMLNDNVR